tara:strand:+ start:173 stop:2074 length:1902 start_codon:yes stop_codon:yes gene_type:complete
MYIKANKGFKLGPNQFEIILTESDRKKQIIHYKNIAYRECNDEDAEYQGLNGEPLKPVLDWFHTTNKDWKHKNTPNLHFQDMDLVQKFLVEKYGTNDEPSTNHREIFFDIECEIGGALTEDYIESAPMPITSIAWWDKQEDEWFILILDKKSELGNTKKYKKKTVIPCSTEEELLTKFRDWIKANEPDILIGYNSDFFDIPYLYYRMVEILGRDEADKMSPMYGKTVYPIISKKFAPRDRDEFKYNPIIINGVQQDKHYFAKQNMFVQIKGIESLDYIRLHKKFSWKDEPSWTLDAIGEKYTGIGKVEYEGNLDQLFETDIQKFIQYNFRDVEILKLLDEKLQYIALTKNLSHKGKHNYHQVYANSITQDGAISAYLLGKNIIPPPKEQNQQNKKGYAGGYLFCPQAGLYKYMFDEDLTSLYPSIIMTCNIGKETLVGRVIEKTMHQEKDKNNNPIGTPFEIVNEHARNNRLGLNDLDAMDPHSIIYFQTKEQIGTNKWEEVKVGNLVYTIKKKKWKIAANGSVFHTDEESTLSIILKKWFEERKLYKDEMKKAYKANDKEKGEYYYLMQYTMKILLNSLYGATALPSFRYGMNLSILSEAITLSGHRIIQESALCANKHMNKVIKGELKLEL